jgi:hypothetical protein
VEFLVHLGSAIAVLILSRAALAVAHAHGWHPEHQLKNLFLRGKHQLIQVVLKIRRAPRIENAPGLVLTRQKRGWKAEWRASKKGFEPQRRWLARLPLNPEPAEKQYVSDWCIRLQAEMLNWRKEPPPKLEPSMEEILASIRSIIAEDSPKAT